MTTHPVAGGIAVLLVALLAFWLWTPDRDRASLEARYLQAPTDIMQVAGQRLHVRDTGPRQAPAILMVHGFGASLHTWESWAQALSGSYRVVRFDLPGSGLSDPDPQGDYSDARTMVMMLALIDQLAIPRAHVVGHSIGGRIAWTFAAHHPQRVDRLVLLSPDGFASPGADYGKQPDVPMALGLMRYVLPKPLLRMNLEPAYANPAVMTDALTTQYHDLMLAPGSRQALLTRMTQTVLTDPVPWLQRIQAPTLLVWGDKDAFIPIANAADYVRVLPRSTLVTLPGVGHVPQEEADVATLAHVRAFLQ
jgi:pimeloyl-ACP methyl ester carboxylesterase